MHFTLGCRTFDVYMSRAQCSLGRKWNLLKSEPIFKQACEWRSDGFYVENQPLFSIATPPTRLLVVGLNIHIVH